MFGLAILAFGSGSGVLMFTSVESHKSHKSSVDAIQIIITRTTPSSNVSFASFSHIALLCSGMSTINPFVQLLWDRCLTGKPLGPMARASLGLACCSVCFVWMLRLVVA